MSVYMTMNYFYCNIYLTSTSLQSFNSFLESQIFSFFYPIMEYISQKVAAYGHWSVCSCSDMDPVGYLIFHISLYRLFLSYLLIIAKVLNRQKMVDHQTFLINFLLHNKIIITMRQEDRRYTEQIKHGYRITETEEVRTSATFQNMFY